MTTTDELAQRLILLSALEKRVSQLRAETKAELHQHISPGTTVKPVLADGKSVGRVSYVVNRTIATVTDPAAFGDWIAERYPAAALGLVVIVSDSVTRHVLAISGDAGMPVGPGGECGPDGPPGITVKETGGYISATPDKERVSELWAEVRNRLPELTGAELTGENVE